MVLFIFYVSENFGFVSLPILASRFWMVDRTSRHSDSLSESNVLSY